MRALVAVVSSVCLLIVSFAPSSLTAQASAASSIYGETYATLSSFSGVAGDIAVSGGGYQPGTEVAVFVGGGAIPAGAAKATVSESNAFGPVNVNIPVGTPQGPVTITVEGIGGVTDGLRATNSYYVVPFTASITVTAAAHTPNTPVVISGSGFAPGEDVNIALATAKATVKADAAGAFKGASILVPRVQPNSYELTATGAASGAVAVDYFYVDQFFPSAYPSAYYLLPGQTLQFSGQGYEQGETVDVIQGEGAPLASFVVTGSTFENVGGFVIPLSWANSSRELNLIGRSSGGNSAITVTVGQFFPSVSPTVYYVMPGGKVAFNGNGFAGGEKVSVYAGMGTTPVSTITSDESGSFEEAGSYTVPYGSSASATFRFVGVDSKAETTTTISVGALFPQIQPSDYYVRPGSPMSVTGSGFAAGENVSLTAAGIDLTAVADEDGAVTFGPFAVPFGATESLTLTANGETSTGTASVTVTIGTYNATASASSYYLMPGSPLTINGGGFAPGESVELVQGEDVLATAVADQEGKVTNEPIMVPFASSGPVTYGLRGVSSKALAEVTVTVGEFAAQVSADNYYVQPGTVFNITGSGFAADEAVTAKLGEVEIAGVADEFGNVGAIALTMPFPAAGETSVEVTLQGNSSKAKASTNITAAPFWANVSPSTWYDQSGKPVMFTGNGFANGETVTVQLNGEPVTTVMVGADGTFELSGLTLPYGVDAANYSFVGGLSNATASISVGLAPYSPSVSPSTWYGQPGSPISFEGSGFAPGETVTVSRGLEVVGTVEADELGAFSFDGGALPFAGPVAYSFVGNLTNAPASFEVGVAAFYAGLQLDNYYGPGGTALVIDGSGFAPGETVALSFGGTSVGSAVANASGAFSKKVNAPYAPAGDVKVTGTGAASGAVGTTGFTYAQVWNGVELGSYAVAPGAAVNFIGSGYLPNEPVQVKTDRGAGVVHSFTASATGAFNDSGYVIPAGTTSGPLTLTITGTQSFTSHEITIWVTEG